MIILSKYIIYLDANNLYGSAMCEPLPVRDFKWLSDEEIDNFNILKISDYSENGYILEVDIKYPKELHNTHSDYPLAPENKLIDKSMLSNYLKKEFNR